MLRLVVDWQQIEIDFHGEKITAEVRPMRPEHALIIMPHFQGKQPEGDPADWTDEQRDATTRRMFDVQIAAAHIFPEVVRNITGLEINGLPVTTEMLGAESVLSSLAVQIITQVVIASAPSAVSEKNLPLPPFNGRPGETLVG